MAWGVASMIECARARAAKSLWRDTLKLFAPPIPSQKLLAPPRQSVTQVAARAGCSAWIDIGPMHFMSRGCDHGASFSSEFVLVCMRWRNARGMRVVVVAAGIASNVSRRLAAQFGHRTSGFGESGMCIVGLGASHGEPFGYLRRRKATLEVRL